jgi:hypothetical protein
MYLHGAPPVCDRYAPETGPRAVDRQSRHNVFRGYVRVGHNPLGNARSIDADVEWPI